ncbi:hypothetical protein [Pelagibacterium sp. H642]|uniref:hypothetical protein n=1 Tax=Pelagibacterium sp. H642 TaxID=1881069 RepID=UPI0035C1DBA0
MLLVLNIPLIGFWVRLLLVPYGFVLGPLMEEHFRRAMLLSPGGFMTFFDRPISATVMAISAALLVWSLASVPVQAPPRKGELTRCSFLAHEVSRPSERDQNQLASELGTRNKFLA